MRISPGERQKLTERFRAYRRRNLVSQQELGTLLGLSRWSVSRIECGWQTPHWRAQRKFSSLEAREKTVSPGFEWLPEESKKIVMHTAARNSRAEAWRRLGIEDPSVLNALPPITHILAAAKQGLPEVLLALRASNDPDAQAFVRKYDSVSPSDRRYRIGSNWEAIAFAAGVDPRRLLENAVSCLIHHEESLGQIVAAASHPRIIKKTVQIALTRQGHRERKMLLSAAGFLPTPKGFTLIRRMQIAKQNESRTAELDEQE